MPMTAGSLAGAVAAVAFAGVGAAALMRAPLPEAAPVNPADAMQIAVVAPTERSVAAGGPMDVGELVDGYEHVPIPARTSEMDTYDPGYETAWLEPLPTSPRLRSAQEAYAVQPAVAAAPAGQGGSRFGFDAPGPDYAAERSARRERLDRMQTATPVPSAAGLRTETTFY
jgi:hypothetical protein